ncbi:MAG: 50S ribosomal protein L29 [Thermoplasmatota archaeon]
MLKAKEIREMNAEERQERLNELRHELMRERGIQAMGGSAQSPGKIRTLRREIARILTIAREEELGLN